MVLKTTLPLFVRCMKIKYNLDCNFGHIVEVVSGRKAAKMVRKADMACTFELDRL